MKPAPQSASEFMSGLKPDLRQSPRVNIRAAIPHETDERLPARSGEINRERSRRRNTCNRTDASRERLLNDLE